MKTKLTKCILIGLGTLCVGFGVVGIFLPVLPTTPFLLLAGACYARSSRHFYHWLLTNRLFGEYIRNYREGHGVPLRQKILTIILLWLTIGWSVSFAVSILWLRILLLAIAAAVTLHLVTIRTYRRPADRHCSIVAREQDSR